MAENKHDKTKIMVNTKIKILPRFTITVDGAELEQVTQFCYLGSLQTEDARCQEEKIE